MKNLFSRPFRIFICLIFFSVPFGIQSAFPQSESPIQAGESNRSIMSGNQNREYLLYIPAKYDGKTPLPLVFLFHGMSSTPKGTMEYTGLRNLSDKKGFVIAAPAGIRRDWNIGSMPGGVNDVEFVRDLIREISSKVAIDKKRIYATGFSQGARMCSRLACDLSNEIAAVGGVGGIIALLKCPAIRPVPTINFYGTEDRYYVDMADAYISFWVKQNGCQETPETKEISRDVMQMTYINCKNNAEVVSYRINGGGHTWPDSSYPERMQEPTTKDINATNLIWSFFDAHPLP